MSPFSPPHVDLGVFYTRVSVDIVPLSRFACPIMPKKRPRHPVPVERIEKSILLIRSEKVLLDRDLAKLYGVKSIALRQQVGRNIDRFPEDFMFRLTEEEADALVSQNVIPSKRSLGGSLPYVFTQEGVAMLSSVLRSEQAVQVNIQIMRAFVRLRGQHKRGHARMALTS